MAEKILITGGAGFAGHHVVEHILKNTDMTVVVWDNLTYAANGWNRLRDIGVFDYERVIPLSVDITQPITEGVINETGYVNWIVHMAAETHVDRSITNPEPFVRTNVLGTMHVLNYAVHHRPEQFVYFSTDEVFGPAPEGVAYKEWDRYDSGNPYSASKAGAEELALAYANTYKLPVLVTHTMNLFGERQHPEKFIPLVIKKVQKGELVTIHANPTRDKAGSRFYIHCRNMADALLYAMNYKQWNRNKLNIVGTKEMDNLELAQFIANIVGKPLHYEMVDFHSSRPGHDLRYALDGNKLYNELGWKAPVDFEDSLAKTIEWTLEHPDWLEWGS